MKPEIASGGGRPTHATLISIFAIVAAIASAASLVAMIAIGRAMSSSYQVEELSQLGALDEARATAFWISLFVAPAALLLSIGAMYVRARRPSPKPKLPIFALTLSLVPIGFLSYIVFALLAMSGQMH
ncbi:MAG TPA: hypothetical protein VFQ26_05140 [Nitrospiraceae bacterium]|nr:hypothetical protein [Nitrospiraceae bacterium]